MYGDCVNIQDTLVCTELMYNMKKIEQDLDLPNVRAWFSPVCQVVGWLDIIAKDEYFHWN